MTNTKIIAVTGSTGTQGGGVVNILKKTPGWRVRAVTRNPDSEAAKKLAADGIEVVRADFDDEVSLRKAFEGVAAVFAVTNWWEQLFSGRSQWEAGEIEERHGINLARAAAHTPTLEHYIWSTVPGSQGRVFPNGEKVEVPHLDYKARVDARIKAELPELARKTTYLYLGYYAQNLAYTPMVVPFKYPPTGQYLQLLATPPQSQIFVTGDMSISPGVWVRQVLATGARAFGRYANVGLERLSFQQMLDKWSAATGKQGVLVQVAPEVYTRLWGDAGTELVWQFRFGELCDPWAERDRDDFITPEELGIDQSEVVGFEDTIRGLAKTGVWD